MKKISTMLLFTSSATTLFLPRWHVALWFSMILTTGFLPDRCQQPVRQHISLAHVGGMLPYPLPPVPPHTTTTTYTYIHVSLVLTCQYGVARVMDGYCRSTTSRHCT